MATSLSLSFRNAALATYRADAASTTIYRRAEDGGVWHHRPDCDDWPADNFRVTSSPPDGVLCPHCDRLKRLEFGPNGQAA